MPKPKICAKDRFSDLIFIAENGCWDWQGAENGTGYGVFYDGNKKCYAHRYSYSIFKGDIPIDLQIDHLCRNRRCVNPAHLEVVTCKENIRRGDHPNRCKPRNSPRCRNGHLYTLENTYHRPNGQRECRICMEDHRIKWESKRKWRR